MDTDFDHLPLIMSGAETSVRLSESERPSMPQWRMRWTYERMALALITMLAVYCVIRVWGDVVAVHGGGLDYLAIAMWAIAVIGSMTLASSREKAIKNNIVPIGSVKLDERPRLEILSELERMREAGHMDLPAWVKYMAALESAAPWLIWDARIQAAKHDWNALRAELLDLDHERVGLTGDTDAARSRYRTHLERMAPELIALARTQLSDSENAE